MKNLDKSAMIEALFKIIDVFGVQIINDGRRFYAALSDMLPGLTFENERKILEKILEVIVDDYDTDVTSKESVMEQFREILKRGDYEFYNYNDEFEEDNNYSGPVIKLCLSHSNRQWFYVTVILFVFISIAIPYYCCRLAAQTDDISTLNRNTASKTLYVGKLMICVHGIDNESATITITNNKMDFYKKAVAQNWETYVFEELPLDEELNVEITALGFYTVRKIISIDSKFKIATNDISMTEMLVKE